MPAPDRFATPSAYYSTALHELGHWTAHPDRLNPPLKPDYGEPIYFTLAPLWSGTFYRLWEEVSNDGFIEPGTERELTARLEPHTISITTDPKANFTAADKAKNA